MIATNPTISEGVVASIQQDYITAAQRHCMLKSVSSPPRWRGWLSQVQRLAARLASQGEDLQNTHATTEPESQSAC